MRLSLRTQFYYIVSTDMFRSFMYAIFRVVETLRTVVLCVKCKGEGLPMTGHDSPEGEEMCSSTLTLSRR